MSDPTIEDYQVEFEDALGDKTIGDAFAEFLIGIPKYIGSLFGAADILDKMTESEIERSFIEFLHSNDTELPDLRSRSGITATFLIQRYTRYDSPHTGHGGIDTEIVITPVGVGHDTRSTLLYSMAGSANTPDKSEYNPELPKTFGPASKPYRLKDSNYFNVSLEDKTVFVMRHKAALKIFDERADRLQILKPETLSRGYKRASIPDALLSRYRLVKNMLPSIKNAKLEKSLSDMRNDNIESLNRLADLEKAYQQAASKAEANRMISLMSGAIQLGLGAAGYAQKMNMQKARQADMAAHKTAYENMTKGINDLNSTIKSQKKSIDALNKNLEGAGVTEIMFQHDSLEVMSERYLEDFRDAMTGFNGSLKLEKSQGGFIKLHLEYKDSN